MSVVLAEIKLQELYTKDCITPSNESYPHYNLFLASNMSFIPRYLELPEDARSLKPDFPTSKPSHGFKSVSQSGQDFAILSILQDMSHGYFIDLAANDFKAGSNSYLLEQFNFWNGVCIEPNSIYWKNILANRRCHLYVNPVSGKAGEKVKFRMATAFGGIVGEEFDQRERENDAASVELETTTLTLILDHAKAPHVINYMNLDIEGAELVAMSGFDFNKYKIWLINVERPKPKLHYLLAKHGYVFLHSMTEYGDILYVHFSTPNFEKIFKDQYQSIPPVWFHQTQEHFSVPKWTGDSQKYVEDAAKLYKSLHGKQ